MNRDSIRISPKLSIPIDELRFTASRSSGPGGQNVNKVNTRVTIWFDVVNSPSLSANQKKLIRKRLPTRISKAGVLRVVSQKHRTQKLNRDTSIERLRLLLGDALRPPVPRKKTSVPGAVRQRRLDDKKHRSRIKLKRGRVIPAAE